jgi:hypothetical protein
MKRRLKYTGTLKRILAFTVVAIGISGASSRAQLLGPSTQRDIEQGAEISKLVEQQIGLCALPTTEAYLRAVGERLVAAAADSRW